jgi:ABC-type antimicrobial peptide transport system permease subunit
VRSAIELRTLVDAIKRELRAVDSDVPISNVRTLDEAESLSIAPRRLNLLLISGFASVGLLLCLVGVYGVMSYAVNECTREIGVRLALGANPRRMLAMVLARGLRLAAIGAVAGAGGALVVSRLLRGLLYSVPPGDPTTFATVTAAVIVVALVASYVPARRAMRTDPLIALRDE